MSLSSLSPLQVTFPSTATGGGGDFDIPFCKSKFLMHNLINIIAGWKV